ncbi:MAG: adenylate kinase [Cyanobacteriota bacterium]|nr:adenylate kinase [Cyanobacteriota bacterium]
MAKRLIFLGPPGAGKGTQAQQLAESMSIPHISTGEILRSAIASATPLGTRAKAYVDAGELVPDALMLDLIRDRLAQPDAREGWILDGFPRNVSQAEFLDKLLSELKQQTDCVLSLTVPDEVLIARLLGRGRRDDSEETIRRRLEVYREQTAPVNDFYQKRQVLHGVNGDRSPETVTAALRELVEA